MSFTTYTRYNYAAALESKLDRLVKRFQEYQDESRYLRSQIREVEVELAAELAKLELSAAMVRRASKKKGVRK